MGRIIAKVLSQALLLLGPIITLNWSILNWLGYDGGPSDPVNLGVLGLNGPKQQVEFNLRLAISAIGWLWVLGTEITDYFIPRRDFKEFRSLYLNKEAVLRWRKTLAPGIRINILHTRRPWFLLWAVRVFRWTWSDGFNPPSHFDVNLKLTEFQGVCGKALRAQLPRFVDFRELAGRPLQFHEKWFLFNQFHLWPWQIKKVRHLKAVLSVPIFRESKGTSPKWKPIGIVNLDAVTDEAANFLKDNRNRLGNYFAEDAKILACLR